MADDDKFAILSDLEKLKRIPARDDSSDSDDLVESSEEEIEEIEPQSQVAVSEETEESPQVYLEVLNALESAERGEDLAQQRHEEDDSHFVDVEEAPLVENVFVSEGLEPIQPGQVLAGQDFPYENFQFAEEGTSCSFAAKEQDDPNEEDVVEIESDDEFGLLADEELDEDDDIPVSYNNALILNENYQQEIRLLIENLEEALKENQERQANLTSEIEALSAGLPLDATTRKESRQNSVIARNPLTIFHAPYFKDVNLYTHPPNEDTLRKAANGELDLYLVNPRELNDSEKKSLLAAVREDAIAKKLKSLVEEETKVLTNLRKAGISLADKDELRLRLRKLIAQETDIKSLPDEVLFQVLDEEFDWLKIAAQAFNRTVTPELCRLMWKNQLHPLVNTGKWTKAEDKQLKALVSNPDEDGLLRQKKDWDRIAAQLGTGRTAFLAFQRYQTKHNRAYDNRRWTAEEDSRLRELVRQCRINRFVPWTKVSYYMHNRTKDQCYQRYMYSLRDEVRQGLFEEVEDFVIIVGVKLFGPDWMRISHFIPTRTPMQIHSRYNTFLKANFENWTQDEDLRLLNAVKANGNKDWRKVATLFTGRTRTQCRQRFQYIFKTYQKTNNFSLQQLPYVSDDSKQKIHQEELYKRLDSKVEEFLKNNAVAAKDSTSHHLSDDDDDDDDDDEDDAELKFSFISTKNYHVTPEGEKIPMKALLEFMRQLGDDLPKAERHVKPAARNVGLLKSKFTTIDNKGNLSCSPILPPVNSNNVAYMNGRYEKVFKCAWPVRHGREKEVYRSIRDVKIARQVGRTFCDILQASYLCDRGPECNILLQHTLRKPNECKENRKLERQRQFLEILRAKSQDGVACRPLQALVGPEVRPAIKTYSRKTKQRPTFKRPSDAADSSSPAPPKNVEYLKLMAPNMSTLVGMRALLLKARNLKESSKKYLMLPTQKNEVLRTAFKDQVFFGIRRPDPNILSSESKDGRLSAQEAERRLRDRFLSLFFWPGVMATVRPNERKDVFDINEEDEVVAASDPLDVSTIIADAKTKTASAPRVVVVRKRKPTVIASGSSSSSSAPPPIKKRLLAEASEWT